MMILIIYFLILLSCVYYCALIVFATGETFWIAKQGGLDAFWWCICPWVGLYMSHQSWTVTRIWRRMKAQRYEMPSLSRSHHQEMPRTERVSFLEYICLGFITLSLFAVREQWIAPNLWWRAFT